MPTDKATSKKWARGFKWGKREHKYRKYTLRLTIIGLLILVLYYFVRYQPILVGGIAIILLAIFTNLWAGFAHVQEKKIMDRLRFPWLKKKKK